MTHFFTNSSDSLDKTLQITRKYNYEHYDIKFLYEIERCVNWIKQNNFKKVCLQFPDNLLQHSVEVAKEFEAELGECVYILADTAYETCCIDYVAAAHIDADAIIHFGGKCFSKQSDKLPSLFIYEKPPLDLDKLFNKIVYKFSNKEQLMIIIDTPYIHYKERIHLIKNLRTCVDINGIDETFTLENAIVLYIGENDRKLLNFHLIYKPQICYYFDNLNSCDIRKYDFNTNVLKRRNFLIEKIKDSKTVGIVIGTIAIREHLKVLQRIKELLKIYNKKYYLISIGKPNEAKLLNFPEMDVYVLISCAMNDFLEKKDFYKPLVTPYDIELALNPNAASYDQFTYELDFVKNDLNDFEIKETYDVSLITGQMRSVHCKDVDDDDVSDGNGQEVALRADGTLAISTASGAGYLAQRSWKGLEQNLGKDAPSSVTEGSKGIAQNYESEPK